MLFRQCFEYIQGGAMKTVFHLFAILGLSFLSFPMVPATASSLSARTPAAGDDAMVYRYRLFEEPQEKAFTVLVPQGWQTSGGLQVTPRHQVQTLVDGCGKRIHFAVYDPLSGARVEYFPFEMIHTTAPGASFIPVTPGQVLNGMVQIPQVLSPADYMAQYLFPQARQGASSVQWEERKRLDGLARAWHKAFHAHEQVPLQSVAESVVVSYEQNGERFAETWTGLITYLSVSTSTIWTVDFAVSGRVPLERVAEFQVPLKSITDSFRVNSRWHANAVAHFSECAEQVRMTQEQIRQIDRAMTEHRREVQEQISRIDREMAQGQQDTRGTIQKHEHNTLMGLAEYEDPEGGWRTNLDLGYERTLTNGTEIIQTNDLNFDPPPGYRPMREIWNTTE